MAVIIVINYIFIYIKEVQIVKEINTLMDSGQYEKAFDSINNSDLSYDDIELYSEKLIPYMKDAHEEMREKEGLALVLDDAEYYITEDIIYSKKDGEDTKVLYSTPDYNQTLRAEWSIYANGCLFFVEMKKSYGSESQFTTKYIDLQTGDIEILGRANSRGDMVKLENGCIFIGQNIWDFNEGIYYNPYTESIYTGEEAVTDVELENAIYMN